VDLFVEYDVPVVVPLEKASEIFTTTGDSPNAVHLAK
jgi:hypothetical protein